jgi:hypothetical protein
LFEVIAVGYTCFGWVVVACTIVGNSEATGRIVAAVVAKKEHYIQDCISGVPGNDPCSGVHTPDVVVDGLHSFLPFAALQGSRSGD